MKGGWIIRRARRWSGLTQSELASELSISRSTMARWEDGSEEPPFETVIRAVRACGLELSLGLYTYDFEHDLHIDENLRLTPERRLDKMVAWRKAVQDLISEMRRARG